METNDLIVTTLIGLCYLVLLVLIYTYRRNADKMNFYKQIPSVDGNFINVILNNDKISAILYSLSKANGMEDSPELIIRETLKGAICGVVLLLNTLFIPNTMFRWIGLALFALLIVWPFVRRILDKKDFRKKYIVSFYEFLNYLVLYLSGGVPMADALREVDKLIGDNSPLKPRLESAIARNTISGLSGDTYINALEELNAGLDFNEIKSFINLARRSEKRGDPVADSLLSQMDDISKKVNMDKRAAIAKSETVFESIKMIGCFLPLIIAMAGPILVSALSVLSF